MDLARHVRDVLGGDLGDARQIPFVPLLGTDEGDERFLHPSPTFRCRDLRGGLQGLLLLLVLEVIHMVDGVADGRAAYRSGAESSCRAGAYRQIGIGRCSPEWGSRAR